MFTFAPKKMFSLILVATLAGLAGFAAGLLYERSRGAKALQTARAEAVAATARLEAEENGRRLTFRITAEDEQGPIGEATHVRFVVDRERFLKKL